MERSIDRKEDTELKMTGTHAWFFLKLKSKTCIQKDASIQSGDPVADEEGAGDSVGEHVCSIDTVVLEGGLEGGNEGLGEGSFGEEVAEQIGNAKGDIEGVGEEGGAHQRGEELFANQSENSRQHGGRGNESGRAGEPGLLRRLSHCPS